MAVAIGSIVLGAAVATSPRYTIAACAALVVGLALLKRPPIGVVAVLMVAAILGDSGAHVLVMGVPLLELLLVLASLTAVARIVAVPGVYVRTATLVWVVPALWGFLEFAARNRGQHRVGRA